MVQAALLMDPHGKDPGGPLTDSRWEPDTLRPTSFEKLTPASNHVEETESSFCGLGGDFG